MLETRGSSTSTAGAEDEDEYEKPRFPRGRVLHFGLRNIKASVCGSIKIGLKPYFDTAKATKIAMDREATIVAKGGSHGREPNTH